MEGDRFTLEGAHGTEFHQEDVKIEGLGGVWSGHIDFGELPPLRWQLTF